MTALMDVCLAFYTIAVAVALTAVFTHNLGLPNALTVYMLSVSAFMIITAGIPFYIQAYSHETTTKIEHSRWFLILFGIWLLMLLTIMFWIIAAVLLDP